MDKLATGSIIADKIQIYEFVQILSFDFINGSLE
jgi:hypothetical protein